MRKVTKKDKRRITLLVIIFIPLLVFFVGNMFSYWSKIYNNMKETEVLQAKYEKILEEEKELKSNIVKLQNEEYVARYVREKYLYSKDGEIIIKIK